MKFNATVTLLATILCVQTTVIGDDAAFHWTESSSGITDLLYGEAPVLRYMHAYDDSTPESLHDTYKVFHHVFGPETGELITNGAGGKFTHHRGLFVGWNKTATQDGPFDFWHCKDGAHLKHVEFLEKTGDTERGRMVARIHWNNADGKAVIEETRTVEVCAVEIRDARAWQIDWSTTLVSSGGLIKLDGDRQHAGFQFRAAQPVADANSGRYLRPAEFPEQEEAFQVNDKDDPTGHINLNWFAMSYPLGTNSYTVEYMEAPGQPQPSRYSERPYGRFGAFYKAEIDVDRPLVMKYRLIVSEGPATSREEIQRRYDDFCGEVRTESP